MVERIDYPRPQMMRDNWQSLDGIWYCTFSEGRTIPDVIDTKIMVPFSPEARLSGVGRNLQPDENLFYKKTFKYHRVSAKHVLLHFQAVDQECVVFLNDKTLGSHIGGYLPFWYDVTQVIAENNELVLIVTDKHEQSELPRGKQRLKPSKTFHTGQSGIWQSVWLEEVPEEFIEGVTLLPILEKNQFLITVHTNTEKSSSVTIMYDGNKVQGITETKIVCKLQTVHPWTPDDPFLYPLTITCGEDRISSYIAMRSFSVKGTDLQLNGKTYFHHGVLYQGYWKDGLYTPPNDAQVLEDLKTIKKLGFNTVRLHQKIETLKWYNLCDRLGLIVWQDMPSGGMKDLKMHAFESFFRPKNVDDTQKHTFLGSEDRTYRLEFLAELKGMVRHLFNCPCIGMWTIFSNGIGQYDSERIRNQLLVIDQSRIINPADGFYDQGKSNVKAIHVYGPKYHFQKDVKGRAVIITECGGYTFGTNEFFKYHSFDDQKKYNDALIDLYKETITPAKEQGLAGCIYMQFNDFEQETDGLVSCERALQKIDLKTALTIRSLLFQDTDKRDVAQPV